MYLFYNFLLVLVGWAVGEVITNIALEVEEPADSKGELVLTVSDIKTDDGEGITDEWTSGLEAVIDNVLDLVVIEKLLNE